MSLTDVLDVFCWCLPGFPRGGDYQDREPLLPQYNDDTVLQRELHQKLHTYQMLRALTQGFMPSNEQAIINLRTLLASDVLNPENDDLSDSGRALVHYTKAWLKQFIELLQHKNSDDQIQDFVWYLSKSRVSIDMEDIANRTAKAQKKAKTAAGEHHVPPVLNISESLMTLQQHIKVSRPLDPCFSPTRISAFSSPT